MELEQGQPSWIEFSGVHLTRAGAATAPTIETILDEDLEHGALGQNALLNGNFESWSDGRVLYGRTWHRTHCRRVGAAEQE